MTFKRSIASSLLLGMALAVPSVVSGHHAISAEFYGADKQVPMKGVVTQVLYTNPHPAIYIDVTNKDGTKTSWEIQVGTPPANLFRQGWRKDQVKVGATLDMMVLLAKDGVLRAHLQSGTIDGVPLPLGGGARGGAPSPAAR